MIYFYNFLLVLCGKDADHNWDHKTGFKNNSLTLKRYFGAGFAYDLTYPQMKAIKVFFDKYPDYDIIISLN